ncbi:MAG: magnesium transporter [bacterium]|nr:magnesium transporter [bacterium]
MQIKVQQAGETIRRLIRRDAFTNLKKILDKTHPADIAYLSRDFTQYERDTVFKILKDDIVKTAAALSEMELKEAVRLLELVPQEEIKLILLEMPPDDRVDIISSLPEELSESVLQLMKKAESDEVENLMGFDENTAGGIMNTEFHAFDEEMTAKEAIDMIQKTPDIESYFYVYVIDDRNHLVGVLSLRQLIVKPGNTKLKNIMQTEVTSVHTGVDQEEVARQVARYNFLAIPVVDEENKLVGIVTVDDTIDVIREEATEDFLKLAGTSTQEITEKSVLRSLKVRSPWLLASLAGGILAAVVISSFEVTLERFIGLSAFLPVIIGMGGNVGVQSSTLMVRGLATGRINITHIWKVIGREILIGASLGVIYGILLGLLSRLLILANVFEFKSDISFMVLGLVVGLGICTSMLIATVVGAFVPILLEKMKIDPALASGPFVTTAIDVLGVGSYLYIAATLIR